MSTLINNRYAIVEQLGKGGMGTVYLVEDTLREDQPMTLKMIRTDLIDERSLAQFKYEFTALAQLRHPNLVTVYDFSQVADTREYFYTMEYVPGEDLHTIARQGREGYDWLYEVVVQVCRALQYIHSRGFIHYDVKPRNIRIMPDGVVKLMDFGLIGEARGEGQLRVRGTPEYIAPELVRGDPVDHRADLYSLGVSLYEVVTGSLPFTGESSMQILRQHVEARPEPPQHFVADVPSALQALILKLMTKEPINRYSSANAVIQAINELAGLDFPVETKETKRGYIQSGNFVGREFELARLQGLLMRMMQGQGRLVFITGAAGVGKTRLVRELRLRAQMQRVFVAEGICLAHARSPYRPWVNIFSQLILYQSADEDDAVAPPTWWAQLAQLMPDLAPQLGPLAAIAPEGVNKQALLETAARFLREFKQPLLIILEDLHFADNETLELLDYIGVQALQTRQLICGVYRDEDVETLSPLTNVVRKARLISQRRGSHISSSMTGEQPYELLRLEVLSQDAAADFVRSMLGVKELPDGLLPRLMAETGGNPLFIESVMQSLVEEDLLRYDGEVWHIALDDLTDIPASIQDAARRRLQRLDAASLDLLQWASVLGQWVELDILAAVANRAPEYVFAVIAQSVRQHVLVAAESAQQSAYRFSNDQMREAVYLTLPAEERARRHRHVGEVLRGLYNELDIAELLAWHFELAENFELALYYAKIAGDKARRGYAVETAIQHYTRAQELLAAHPELGDAETHYDILEGRAACYNLAGERQREKDDLDAMAKIAESLGDVSRQVAACTRSVNLANLLGNHLEARETASRALELARQVGNRHLEADGLRALGEAALALSEHTEAHESLEAAVALYRELGDASGEARALWRLGDVGRRTGRVTQAAEYFELALHIYRTLGNRRGESDVLNALGNINNDYALKRNYYEQSLAIAQSIGDRHAQSRAYNNLALTYWSLGLYSRGRDYMEQSVQIQREMQGRSSLAYYLETLGRIYYDLGEYQRALQVFEEGRAIAMDIGDRLTEAIYWMGIGRVMLARDRAGEARQMIQIACDMLREIGAIGYLATTLAWLGIVHLELGDWEAAHQATAEAVTQLDEAGGAVDFPAQDIWWCHYQVLKAGRAQAGTDVLADEVWACLQQTREVMLAGIATLSDEGLRRNYLNKVRINREIISEWTRYAVTHAEEEGVPTLLGDETALPPAVEHIEERLKRVLDISVQMNETHDAEMLLNYVMDQVIELSGAERGFLVLMDETGQMNFRVARGMAEDEIERAKAQVSYTVLGSVAQSKMPVLLQDAMTDERFARQSSVLELNLRSVLCVPLVSGSELVGMIYADNRSVSGRFSQSDVDLLTIFANQAASAIENAHLYEETIRANKELEAWAHTLEQRVAERTAALQQANVALSQRALQLETSSQVAQQVTSILTLDKLLSEVAHLILTRFDYYFVGVWLLDEKRERVSLRAGTGKSSERLRKQGFSLSLEQSSIVTTVCQTGHYRLVSNVTEDPDFLFLDDLPNVRSELVLPLRMGEQVIGALDITSVRTAAFSDEDLMVLQTLADQISIAIRNAQLYASEQSRRQLAESLEETGRLLSSSLDLQEVPVRILAQLDAVVPFERGALFLQDGKQLRTIAQRGFPDDVRAQQMLVPIREGDVFLQMAESRRPILLDNVSESPEWQQVDWLPLNRSWLGVPLLSKDRVIGMLSLTRAEAGAFSPDDTSLVWAFAGQAAIALENARLYDEITRFNEQLEEMVQARTEELNKAYRTLERLDQTKSDFIGVAAHELRTPLTVIRGYTQVLGRLPKQESEELKDLVKGILSGTDRLHEIVNRMLDVARIDTQTLSMHKESTKVRLIMQKLRTEFDVDLRQRSIALHLEDSLGKLPVIQADPELLYKVFYNLITNAIKYTPDGGEIWVRGRAIVDEMAPAVQVTVQDSGIGIDPENHELIFEKFYQTGLIEFHSSGRTKFKGGGPGLGLAIARGIVAAHGGRIWVESPACDEESCPGSQFHVVLPIA